MNKNSISKTSMDEYPELTQADFDRGVFRKGLKPVEKKQHVAIMIDADIVRYFKTKAGKRGYQLLINETLKNAMNDDFSERGTLEGTLRKVIKEELAVFADTH
jgi:uncharacterized protein (DUF4415 family)